MEYPELTEKEYLKIRDDIAKSQGFKSFWDFLCQLKRGELEDRIDPELNGLMFYVTEE